MTQFKDKSQKHGDNINAGLMTYPVLMAADILLYQTNLVPVGEDQRQHLEISRDIAIRFNNIYGEVFTVPEGYIAKPGAKIMSLQEPDKKMSKSEAVNMNNVISMLDKPDVIVSKIKRAVTDSDNEVRYSDSKPGIKNLVDIYCCMTGKSPQEAEIEFRGTGYGQFKEAVAQSILDELNPVWKRFNELESNKDYIDGCIKNNAARASAAAGGQKLMDTKNCARCGKWFSTIKSTPICPACEKQEEETFKVVKGYIDDHPHSTTAEVSEATDVSVKKILKYLKDGRLEVSAGMKGDIMCDACGKPIPRGRYCDSCAIKINQEVNDIFAADMKKSSPDDEKDKSKNQFYTASKNSSDTHFEFFKEFGDNFGLVARGDIDEQENPVVDNCYVYAYSKLKLPCKNPDVVREKDEYNVGYCDELNGNEFVFRMQNTVDYLSTDDTKGITGINFVALSVKGAVVLPTAKEEGDQMLKLKENPFLIDLENISGDTDLSGESINSMNPEACDLCDAEDYNLMGADYGDSDFDDEIILESLRNSIFEDDVLTVVDAYIIPEPSCTTLYSILADIKKVETLLNYTTNEKIYRLLLTVEETAFEVLINYADIIGLPMVGMRFMGIKTGKDGIAVSAKNVEYMGLEGAAYGYLIGYGKVFRVTEGCAKTALPFIDTFEETKNADIVFGNDSKNYFYTLILPQLKKHGLITEDLNPEEDILKPKSKLFFDCEGKRVTCRVEFVYGETGYNPIRDVSGRPENKIEEFRIIKMLEMLGFESDRVKGLYVLSKDDRIYDLYSGGLDSIRKNAEVFATDAFSGQSIIAGSKAKVGVRIAGNLLRMSVDMGDYSLADLVEAVSSYNVKKKYHRLTDGRFMNLEDEEISAAAEFISSFDVSKKISATIRADSEFKKLTNEFNGIENVEYEVPGELQSVLRPYQQTGFKWLKALSGYEFGGILADDMGLGKTLQVITLLLSEYGDHKLQSLVVAPTSLMYNWEHEFKKFAPIIKTVILSGTPARRQELFENTPDADVFITTYDLLKRDIEMYEKKSFRYIIADEAQYIKNPGTRNATSVKKLKSQARFALTGTPIENALSELWSIFDFILPGYLYNSSKFSRLYETPIIKDDDKERAAQLQWQISPFIMRRLKRDVLTELPDKVETTLYAEMYPEQRKIYLANLLIAKGTLDDAVESGEFMSSKLQILAQITRLRQISCHPGLYIEGYSGGSGKLDLTIETIQSAIGSGHRVLLFSQFTSMLAILRDKLSECGIDYFYLDGGTPSDKRQKMADVFNAGEKQIFLISLRAGGTGLNLTGADVVIHYDQWWNPAVMSQAADRAHRIGQDKVVQVINIVSKDSIEEKILELQSKKKDLVDSVLKEGENFISQMSIEEIRALFTAVAE
ncbi:snf2/rad54 helicase family [Holotrichia oblita]|nr:snf2/rad54 helicase family [Holotrichia oblita]